MAKGKEKSKETFKSIINSLIGEDLFVDVDNAGDITKFSSGSPALDLKLKGGFPKGKVIELVGDPATGKTTCAISTAAEFQFDYPNEPILWLDLEKVFDNKYNESLGLDTKDREKFMLARPHSGEDAWSIMIEFAKNFSGGLIVLDSVPLLLPEKEDEGDMGDAQMASAARMNSQGFRKYFPHASKNNTTMIAINQLSSNIGGYGAQLVTSGGRRWGYYARTRLRFYKSMPTKKEDVGEFNETRIKLEKATYGDEYTEAATRIIKGKGFDKYGDIVDMASDLGIVNKAGSWYSYGDAKLGQGKDSVKKLFEDNEEFYEEVKTKVYTLLGER